MKKLSFICALAALILLGACSEKPDNLTSGIIKDRVKEQLKKSGEEAGYIEIPVGYYELNNVEARYQLGRLAEAGLITYKVERFDWWNKILQIHNSYGDAYGTTNYTEECHVFVDVKLTEAGKKLCVDSIPEVQPEIDKDMVQPEINEADYPENKLTRKEYVAKYENWKEIANPQSVDVRYLHKDQTVLAEEVAEEILAATEEEVADYFADTNAYLKKMQEYKNNENYQVLALDYAAASGYEEAVAKQKREMVTMKAYKLKVEKARYIQIFPTDHGVFGSAEIIVQYKDVTPACRAWYGIYDNMRLCCPVSLIYFYDKGWTLQTKVFNFKKHSNNALDLINEDTASSAAAAKENAKKEAAAATATTAPAAAVQNAVDGIMDAAYEVVDSYSDYDVVY